MPGYVRKDNNQPKYEREDSEVIGPYSNPLTHDNGTPKPGAIVGYMQKDGVVRGVFVDDDVHPDLMMDNLWMKFKSLGYEKMKEWIDEGIAGGGYPSVDSGPYSPKWKAWGENLESEHFGYTIRPDGIVASQRGNDKVISSILKQEEPQEEDDGKYEEMKENFIEYVKIHLIEECGLEPEDADYIVRELKFVEMLEASPDFVMHYMPEYWANRLYEKEATLAYPDFR